MGFAQEAVEAVGDDWSEIEKLNETLERLRRRRLAKVGPEGPLGQSKVAWKIAVFEQAILYRVVMLGDGCATMWNSRNVLGSILCARALVETGALLLDFKEQLARFCNNGDIGSIDGLIMNRSFATRLEGWLDQAPDTKAVNVLGLVDKLDRMAQGARAHYDQLSEMCHPNYWGHGMMFGELDRQTAIVTFSDTARFERGVFDHVIGGFVQVGFVEHSLDAVDALLLRVVELNARPPKR